MISAGFETTDPITHVRTVVVQGAKETSGRGWVFDVHSPEGAPPFLAHLHRTWTETFEIIQGSAICRMGNTEQRMAVGESIVMQPNVPHVHPWNAGTGVMIYRQTNDIGVPNPAVLDEIMGTFATIHGLAREGRVGKNGLPKNPLQFAATGRVYNKHGTFDMGMPIGLQFFLSSVFGRLAEAFGYRAIYERYLR